ncbi:helix-turn-helix domain-containing protein [Clostridium sp. JN-1]|jgi:DNA-binding HxlR family transcriptional regulator|uniref:winged helix-turn-helix transcriptional regulator n=1 Tax=Clostridium sp. JN-1 TaxID=2483110 RepID=UPI000F0BB16A|nr:helix-turn-helix domain-containing protein [Clostridium sp. JN-1]
MVDKLPECPVEIALLALGQKWKFLILRELMRSHGRALRFSEIKNGINNISDKMLSKNLKIMENEGIISRKVFAQVPPRVEYSLTELGMKLHPVLRSLFEWGLMYKQFIKVEKENENE